LFTGVKREKSPWQHSMRLTGDNSTIVASIQITLQIANY